MRELQPLGFIIGGFLLAFAGFAVLFLIVIRVLETSYLLNFASYGASFMGLLLGIIGLTQYTGGGQAHPQGEEYGADYSRQYEQYEQDRRDRRAEG